MSQIPPAPLPPAVPPARPRSCRAVVLTAGFAVLLLMMSRWVDQPLAHALSRHVAPWVDAVFDRISDIGDSERYVIAALLLYVVSLVGLRRGWACPLQAGYEKLARYAVLLMGTMAIGGLITLLLKKVVSRARPEELFERGFHGLAVPFSGDPYDSFPSSHTLTAFAVAAVLAEIAPRWRWPVLAVAVLVALSRVINLDHYLSDVTASAFIGIAVAHYLAPHVLNEERRWMLRAPWRWWRP
ncbi:phosphatase PAP2 family protein [Bordetella sp. 2513F-2]